MFDITDFQKSLKILKNNNELSDFQKVRAFYQLCDKHKVEPILSRLSGSIKSRSLSIYLITFTNSRIIISKKGLLRNFFDFGYIAGLGPFLYYIVSDKRKSDNIKINDSYIIDPLGDLDSKNNFYINYDNIKKLVFYRGIETMTTNILGSTLKYNIFRIFSHDDLCEYIISVRKNGDYEKIFYWLKLALPIDVFEE